MSYDLAALHGVEEIAGRPGLPVQMLTGLGGPDGGGAVVTGIQKLVQRFTQLLLTRRGTVATRPSEGCRFLEDLQRGRLRTVLDVRQSYAESLIDIRRQLALTEAEDDPAAERFADAVLTGVTVGGGRVTLAVLLTSDAGTDFTLQLPLRTLPLGTIL